MALVPIAAMLVAWLAACAPDGEQELPIEVAREVHPVILGQPGANGWPRFRAVLEPGQLLLRSPTSAGWYAIALPPPREERAPRRLTYHAGTKTLTMELGACAIPAYRERLPNRAVLEWDGGRFEGCNGPGRLPARMGDTYWELLRMGSEAAPQGRSPAAVLTFGRDGSLGGTLACNDGGIETRWTEAGGFTAGRPGFTQTAIGCADAAEAFGRRFWEAMPTARSWRREGARLLVTFADGTEAELRYLL
jgi:heat shock protein HslJ